MKRLENKNALVTGASRGIGKAIALQLAREGANVVVHYHNEEAAAKKVAEEIGNQGGQAETVKADLSDVQEVIKLAETAWKVFSGIDLLVNNAGICYKKSFLDTQPEDIDAFFNTNFKGTFFLTQAVAAKMVEYESSGRIVTITSVNGIRPGLGLSAYSASKAALENGMKGAALELAPHNIAVNTLAVGAVETGMTAAVREDAALLQEVNEGIPMGRFGLPEEVAAVVCDVLASGSYLTGSTITLDGGLLLMRGYGKPGRYKAGK